MFSSASSEDCATIRAILEDYARALGQVINFNKSSLCVSKSVSKFKGRRLAMIVVLEIGGKPTLSSGYSAEEPLLPGYFIHGSRGLSVKINDVKYFLWGCEILDFGFRWHIGHGLKVSIYDDRWIPRTSSFRVISPRALGEHDIVSALLSPSGG
ncbi:hypothetical protein Dsin_008312 [Dipteronia sinensis]|uniref:Reverse transcriptase n=1 Tax=Dipteronia sinensis TaxID=43782 RepID=A0AAE0EB29_9ROSI|nr:hypothetical protein Dsin_008312 [Dipteronia sinensis]